MSAATHSARALIAAARVWHKMGHVENAFVYLRAARRVLGVRS